MKYICSWSGGKDSTASIILAHENKEPLDIIVFAEVMFDKKQNISGENPKHILFIRNVAKPLFESWGYQVILLRSQKDYLDIFNHIIERPKKYPEHKGMKAGFIATGLCSVKRDCKLKPINQYYKSLGDDYIQYVGICIDEPKRLKAMHKNASKISLLEKYGYTEEMARDKCQEYGLLSPAYELSKRGGCWFCPNAKLEEHRELRAYDRKTWERFVALEKEPNLACNRWNVYGSSLMERDRILASPYKQLTLFDVM